MSKTKRQYDYFNYTLPIESAEVYAQRALDILGKIKDQFPEFYDNFKCPSEVLTLSGARAFDTYYELGEGVSRDKIDSLKKLLRSHGIVLLEENFPFGNETFPENRYSIVHIEACIDIPNRYKHLPDLGWNQPDFNQLQDDKDFFLWWANWQRNILVARELDSTCKAWVANSAWMAHNLTFGMLLGYPGEAISSLLYETEADSSNGKVIQAKIKHAEKFDGAQPIYSYLQDVADSDVLAQHQKLWSDILEIVYDKLERNG